VSGFVVSLIDRRRACGNCAKRQQAFCKVLWEKLFFSFSHNTGSFHQASPFFLFWSFFLSFRASEWSVETTLVRSGIDGRGIAMALPAPTVRSSP
jgi:hypothetical protein